MYACFSSYSVYFVPVDPLLELEPITYSDDEEASEDRENKRESSVRKEEVEVAEGNSETTRPGEEPSPASEDADDEEEIIEFDPYTSF